MTAAGPRVIAVAVALSPGVRGEVNVQAALEAGVPTKIQQTTFLATTAAAPGVVYATDTRVWEAGTYKLSGTVIVSATNNNTEVEVTQQIDGFANPLPWSDTPGSVGNLFPTLVDEIVLTAGSHTIEILIGRVSGTGDAEANRATVWVEKVA